MAISCPSMVMCAVVHSTLATVLTVRSTTVAGIFEVQPAITRRPAPKLLSHTKQITIVDFLMGFSGSTPVRHTVCLAICFSH